MKGAAILLFGLALLLAAGAGLAQPGGYDLTWSAVGAGGSTSSGGGHELSGTIGRPEAGALSGGSYSLAGGFWGLVGGFAAQYRVYVPLAPKNASGW